MEYYNDLPIYKITIDDDTDGVFMMSIVDTPAVDSHFLKFNKQKKVLYHFNDEKQIITGVALRANYPIYRCDDSGEFYVTFTAEDIERMAHKFMKEKKLNNVNINHSEYADDIYLIESFILQERHNYPEFKDVELGSWIVSYKVDNPDIWGAIKEGRLNGFSVELTGQLESVRENEIKTANKIKELVEIIEIL